MEKTVCELFAGVGGFRCGLNGIMTPDDYGKEEIWETVWYNQWEPAEKNTQYAHDCYAYHFGICLDSCSEDTTNYDIETVNKSCIPDFNLLVGGFPCQDYSVASTLATSKGLEGKKGILWWSIREILEIKKPPFVLLENVDRLLKSPAKQRGRDFAVMLACFRDEGYIVEWRVINAAEYGYQQRRRRIYIFAYKNTTAYAAGMDVSCTENVAKILGDTGFFASSFPVDSINPLQIHIVNLPKRIGEISDNFSFIFENSGFMHDGCVYTYKAVPQYTGPVITLGDVLEEGDVDEQYFIPEEELYYTNPSETHSDETNGRLPAQQRKTWQYLKGAKKMHRTASNGHEYLYSEGAIPMIDEYDKPARTMLTSEGSFSRTTHIVRDKKTGRIRLLTAEETERIQGFPTGHTQYCLTDNKVVEMPSKKRRFMMGNALVVNLVRDMEKELSRIFENE